MSSSMEVVAGDCVVRTCAASTAVLPAPLSASLAVVQRPNAWAGVPGVTSLEDSGSEAEAWDFEPPSPSCSDSSEIPEAILEESSDDDHRPIHSGRSETESWGCAAMENSAGHALPLSKPVPISAWSQTFAWTAGPPVSARESPGGGLGEAATGILAPSAALTPVRRARVRGTLLLPTSSRGEPPQSEQHSLRRPTTAPLVRSTTAPLLRPAPLNSFTRGLGRCEGVQVGEWAARRAHEAEEALAAERLSHEAELERQAREAADRQAILKALDDDRAVLSTSYKQAQAELSRVQAELAQAQAELARKTAEVWDLKDTQDILRRELTRPSRGICVCCLDAPASMAPVPCGHLALCEACVLQLDAFNCPVCRQPSECMIHIFTP